MHHFKFKKEQLYCENLKVYSLAQKFATPLYLYSAKTIEDHFLKLKKAFAAINPLICYSVKANSNLSILKLLISKGAGLDIVSGGELYRAKKVKCPPKRIVYASVGKSDKEIKEAIDYGILMFNVESLAELKQINKIAGRLKKKIDLALRFNPDILASTHRYITTGHSENKFGMDEATIKEIYHKQSLYANVNIKGIHIHIGSQITESAPFIKTIQKVKYLIRYLEEKKNKVSYLNIGGGLGIIYDKEKPQTAQEFAAKVLPLLKGLRLKIILEPGRFIVGNAGILVTKVLYLKETASKRFIIVDAAMNDLIRPSLYQAYHK
ncbi:MAG: diaminopimelate decarboxylase, partial [Candidatus Omnitrophica bacterium]|nr:diaminopimelate decarboxylase [Candidatus Omnitrophota bacterium]